MNNKKKAVICNEEDPICPYFFIQNASSLRAVTQMRAVSKSCKAVADDRLRACVATPMGEGTRPRSLLEMIESQKFKSRPWTVVAYYRFDPELIVEMCDFSRVHSYLRDTGHLTDMWTNLVTYNSGNILAILKMDGGSGQAFAPFGYPYTEGYSLEMVTSAPGYIEPESIDECADNIIGCTATFVSRVFHLRMMDVYIHVLTVDYPETGQTAVALLFKTLVDELDVLGPTPAITDDIRTFVDHTPIVYVEKMFDAHPEWITALLVEVARDTFVLMLRRGRLSGAVFEKLQLYIDISSKM